MRIQLLGSAAAEAVPALWCNCECCKYATLHGGKDIRRRSSYCVDGDTLIDFGPDAFAQSIEFKISLPEIKRILFTHSHEDHLNEVELKWRSKGFSQNVNPIKIYGNQTVYQRINTHCPIETINAVFVELAGGESISDDDLEIFAVPASHDVKENCINYILKRNGKSVLFANDTGWWSNSSWEFAAQHRFNAVIAECTFAFFPNGGIDHKDGHLGARAAQDFIAELARRGALADNALKAVNHFSHNGMPLQHKLEEFYAGSDIKVGYDGMIIEI